MRTHFTTREVARILDLSNTRLRSCLRAAHFLSSRRDLPQFTFQDLLLLKTTKGLLDAEVPVARLRKMLHSLKRQLPQGQQLSNVTIYADGRRVVVWDGTAHWQPDSGQFLFDFEPQRIARQLALKHTAAPRAPQLSAEKWFDLASELEKDSPQEARHAYEEALKLDPACAAAHINLGRLYQEAKQFHQAEACYRAALQHAPHDPLPYFNLGVLLEDMHDPAGAIVAYRAAIAHDEGFGDAHYNLALLHEARGNRAAAIRHLRAVQKLRRRSGDPPREPTRTPEAPRS
jgi:tetratricopeptide (TPR) repeat protein